MENYKFIDKYKLLFFFFFLMSFRITKSLEPNIITESRKNIKKVVTKEFKLTDAQYYMLEQSGWGITANESYFLKNNCISAKRVGKTPEQIVEEFSQKKLNNIRNNLKNDFGNTARVKKQEDLRLTNLAKILVLLTRKPNLIFKKK